MQQHFAWHWLMTLAFAATGLGGVGCSTGSTSSTSDGGSTQPVADSSCVGVPGHCDQRGANSCEHFKSDQFCENGVWVCPEVAVAACTDCLGKTHRLECKDENDTPHCPVLDLACPRDLDASDDADTSPPGDAGADARRD